VRVGVSGRGKQAAMNKLEVCIKKLETEIEAAQGAYFIRPMRLEVAKEVLRQLEAKDGGTNDSVTGGAQPQPQQVLE
jgi:hypothetical protein